MFSIYVNFKIKISLNVTNKNKHKCAKRYQRNHQIVRDFKIKNHLMIQIKININVLRAIKLSDREGLIANIG